MSSQFSKEAIRNMAPILSEDNRFELIANITAFMWLFAGIISDPTLYIASLFVTISITASLIIVSSFKKSYFYDIHTASFRRLIIAGIAHWLYTTGKSQGPADLDLEVFTVPILLISRLTLVGLVLVWFSSRYMDQIRDPNISSVMYPFLILRGFLRGGILLGLIIALIRPNTIGQEVSNILTSTSIMTSTPAKIEMALLVIYLLEPIIYGFSQLMNRTMSRFELTLGNARLPSVALRESFLSNTFILIFTMLFNGVEGQLWALLRVYYILGTIIIFIYSMDAINKFKEEPLGNHAIADFLQDTPNKLQQLDLETSMGHLLQSNMDLSLSGNSSISLDAGSIVVPIDETKGKVNALVLGKGKSIVNTGSQRVADKLEGVSSVLIPAKEFQQLSAKYYATQLAEINLEDLGLPSLQELKRYVNLLSENMGGFVTRVINQINSIDLSNYGIIEEKGRTQVNLPGIHVNETPDLTSVKVAGLRVLDGKHASTVRYGSTMTVVDLPKASFVSLPGITVLDVGGVGSAVSILGFKISDGIPADKLDQFRRLLLKQLDRWELGIDAELGRYLADKSATGLLTVDWNGEFNMLLDSSKKAMGTHQAMQLAGKSENIHYLPPNFDEKRKELTDDDVEFIELTGMDPTPSSTLGRNTSDALKLKSSDEGDGEEDNEKGDTSDEFTAIYDVEIEEHEEEEE